jgi:hypothetical protein
MHGMHAALCDGSATAATEAAEATEAAAEATEAAAEAFCNTE